MDSRHPYGAALTAAWYRLARSGALVRKRIGQGIAQTDADTAARVARAKADAAKLGLHSCGLASCGAREAHASQFKPCAACRTVDYCCKEHQAADWPNHKAACKAARQVKADDAGPSGS